MIYLCKVVFTVFANPPTINEHRFNPIQSLTLFVQRRDVQRNDGNMDEYGNWGIPKYCLRNQPFLVKVSELSRFNQMFCLLL